MKKWILGITAGILGAALAIGAVLGALYLLAGPVTDADRDLYRDHAFTSNPR